jgi:hypothetical protein
MHAQQAGRKPLVVTHSSTPLLADLVTHQNKILVIEMRKVGNFGHASAR